MKSADKIHDFDINKIDAESLWSRFVEGDHAAFEKIYRRHSDHLFQYGMQVIPHQGKVEDAIHDLFIYLWDHRASVGQVKSIRAYLLISLKRHLLRKQSQNKLLFQQDLLSFELQIKEDNGELEPEIIEQLKKSVEKLSPRQREIIYLKFYQGLSYQEIAELLELDLKYTYNLASKAYSLLKSHLHYWLLLFSFTQ